jgi:hypothetical protein
MEANMILSMRFVTPLDVFYLQSAFDLAALSFDEEAKGVESQPRKHHACVIGAVTCSVSFLECIVNGLYDEAFHRSRTTKFQRALESVWSEGFDRQPTLAKYQIALALARREAFGTDSEPYQSAHALIELRNAIAHPKEIIGSEKQQRRLENALRGKYKFGPKREHADEFFPDRCLTPDCAVWAVVTSARFFLEFRRRLPSTAYMFSPERYVAAILEQAKAIQGSRSR